MTRRLLVEIENFDLLKGSYSQQNRALLLGFLVKLGEDGVVAVDVLVQRSRDSLVTDLHGRHLETHLVL